MAKKKKLLFLSSHTRYLEHDLYLEIVKALPKEFHTTYFDSDFQKEVKYKFNIATDASQKKKAFNDYKLLRPPNTNSRKLNGISKKVIRIIGNYRHIYNWRNKFIAIIQSVKPDAIIYISQKEINYKISWLLLPGIPKIYIQPANIAKSGKFDSGIGKKVKRFIYNKLLRLPFYSNSHLNLNEDDSTHYLLWSPIWINHLKIKPRRKNYFVGNPVYDRLFKTFDKVKAITQIPTVVIYLNKKMHIGLEKWELYAKFYDEILMAYPNYNFVFKLHPMDDLENGKLRFKNYQVTKEEGWLDHANLVLTHWSTVGGEAICKGIPTIFINPNGEFDFSAARLENYPATAIDLKSFNFWLKNFQDTDHSRFPEIRKVFIKEQLYSDDGKSTERVVHTIREILETT